MTIVHRRPPLVIVFPISRGSIKTIMLDTVSTIALWAIPAILAITLHEAAHGYVAKLCGDRTAWVLGRVTMNPIRHIDPVGTLLVPGVLLLGSLISGGSSLLFGWAKPVPVNFRLLRNPKTDMIWVALAGPGCNLVQALLWALALKLFIGMMPSQAAQLLFDFCYAGISVNLMLMAFNLLPILPLDGGRIVSGLLPLKTAVAYQRTEPWGMGILLILIVTGLVSYFVRPFLMFGSWLVNAIF